MSAWRQENISLIRTVPERFHGAPYRRVSETFAQRPFDQQALSKVLNREFKVSGSNLRRITRDQTSKAVGQFTHARHRQLGIQEYTWRTAEDERVRATHVALNGTPSKLGLRARSGSPWIGHTLPLCRHPGHRRSRWLSRRQRLRQTTNPDAGDATGCWRYGCRGHGRCVAGGAKL